jgi:hypothetical protein
MAHKRVDAYTWFALATCAIRAMVTMIKNTVFRIKVRMLRLCTLGRRRLSNVTRITSEPMENRIRKADFENSAANSPDITSMQSSTLVRSSF